MSGPRDSRQDHDGEAAPTPGGHTPVMLREVLEALAPHDGGIYLDGTFGAGGYSLAILEAADCRVIAIDRDPEAIARGAELEPRFGGRLTTVEGRYGEMDRLSAAQGAERLDGVALDLGVSSMQLDQAERGFSFRADGPLDMRMDADGGAMTAADVVNNLPEADLADILRRYGEERRARAVARAIVAARPITRTLELAAIVRRVVRKGPDGIDPATRTFQALRIYVNDELGELERGLAAAERALAPGGRLAVVSFHSLEDRAVKRFLQARSGRAPRASRHQPEGAAPPAPSFEPIFRNARRPEEAECRRNPRARSARLRAAQRTAAPAWSDPDQGAQA